MQRLYIRLVDALALAAGIIFALTALAIPVNLVLRACCAISIFGILDAVEYGLMAATFLAAPWVLMHNAHVTVDIFTLVLPAPARRAVAVIVNALGSVLCALLAWYALRAAMVSFERGSMIRTAFDVPEWLTLVAPVIAGTLLAVEFGRRLWRGPVDRRTASGL